MLRRTIRTILALIFFAALLFTALILLPEPLYDYYDRQKRYCRADTPKRRVERIARLRGYDGDVLDDEKLETSTFVHVPKGTAFIDPRSPRPDSSINNTIIHECVHWAKHRSAFLLMRLYNKNTICISCENKGADFEENSINEVTKFMEWQANQLTPRIQMPAEPFKAKATEYISKCMQKREAKYEFEVMEEVISALSSAFNVSKLAAKIRLCNLGFDSALGACVYVDNHYVPPYGFRKDAIKTNQSYSISSEEAFQEFRNNPSFRQLIENGDYLFIENHFVYNTPLYVKADKVGNLSLSDYARAHVDECCLAFTVCKEKNPIDERSLACCLNRGQGAYNFYAKYDNYLPDPNKEEIEKKGKLLKEFGAIRSKMTDDITQCLDILLKWRGITCVDLAGEIEVSERTIRRIANGEVSPQLNTMVRICFGLHLPPTISYKLLDVAGCKLFPTKTDHLYSYEY